MGLFENLRKRREEKNIYAEITNALHTNLGLSLEDFLNPKNNFQEKEKEVILANYKLANTLMNSVKFRKLIENHTVCDYTDFTKGYGFDEFYRFVKKERKNYSYIKKGSKVGEKIKSFNDYIKMNLEDKLDLYTKRLHS